MAINILDEMKNNFLVYATEVNNNRAFPDARDGLKPGMRATLWEMYTKGYFSTKPHVKSAKVTGGTIATWWPHGDSSIYEAVVRMSQPWVNNISEIDFHGGNGSLLGGPDAASSRYTECRLAKSVEDGFFENIKKNAVDYIDNFSEDEKWPIVFPAIFPRLFVNGSQGIGYTIAQEWEPGNLNEFVEKVKEYLKKGKITFNNIYPDFPTGGIIVNKKDLHTIYETGKGSTILRGKAEIDGNLIKITELPYQVYAEPFIQKIKDLVNAETISGIEDICNKSGDDGLLIEIECSADPAVVLNKLYRLTDLQTTFSANQMALVDGVPKMLNLQEYIKVYVDHNINCIQREYKFDLDKAEARLEIVIGLIRAIKVIGNVIATIKAAKSSEDAKIDLVNNLKFTENQAKAIVNMTLGKLANMESTALLNEQTELENICNSCKELLADPNLQQKEFLKRLTEFTKKYGWERRTEVTDVDLVEEKQEAKAKVEKVEEIFNIILTKDNKIKKVAAGKIKKSADMISVIQVSAKDRFVLISATGQMYKLNAKQVSLVNIGSGGQSLNDLVNDKIVKLFTGYENQEFIFMITKNGLAKKIKAATIFELSKCAGAPIMKVDSDDAIIDCRLVDNSDKIDYKLGDKDKQLLISDFIDKGRGAGGVTAIKLGKKLNKFEIKKED